MLARLKRASRRYGALIWAMALVFAVAPAISVAFAAPAGAFSHVFIHAHDHDEDGHSHDVHHHHGDHQHHHGDATDNHDDDQGPHRLHLHYDACSPSMLILLMNAGAQHGLSARFEDQPNVAMRGTAPDRLLRPPIS